MTVVEGVNAMVAGSHEIGVAAARGVLAQLMSGQGTQLLVTGTIGLMVLVIIGVALWAINKGTLIPQLAETEIARGLITFLLSGCTVLIAVLLVLSALFMGSNEAEADRRFTRGKEVLTVLIGVFGTILGFYFGSAKTEHKPGFDVSPIAVARSGGSNATIAAEITGGQPPYKFSIAFKKGAADSASVADRESKEGRISHSLTNATGPLEFTLTILDKGTNRISRDFKEQ